MDNNTFRGSQSENTHKMIFISDLPRNTSYLDLSDYFEKNIGPCQICIKRPLFKQFYYAFVMFDSIENAKKAIEEFRYPEIKSGKISRSLPYNSHAIRGEPGGKDVQSTSIFIKGFEKMKWNHLDLYSKFCQYGKILSCKVSINVEHEPLGFGYVQYCKIEEAQKAIQEMDKYDLSSDGHGAEGILTVQEYQGKKSGIILHKHTFNNVYVKGFPKNNDFTEEDLGELFKQFGDIQNTAIMRDGEGISKGFGFVCFGEGGAAEKATQFVQSVQRMDQTAQGGEKLDIDIKEIRGVKLTDLYIKEAKKKTQRVKELQMNNFKYKKSIMFFSLFVKNFPLGTTEEELKIYFTTACQGGEVTRIIMVPGTQQAFVNFEKQDQCKVAKEFARNVLFKSQYALYVEYCYPKEMRQIRNEELYDKRTQERKKNQATQAQLQSMNGSQNLIDLLTLLLKPAFNFNNAAGQQSRSRSAAGGGQGNFGGQNRQFTNQGGNGMNQQNGNNYHQNGRQGYTNYRSNFQGPNRHNFQNMNEMGQQQNVFPNQRNNSMNSVGQAHLTHPPQVPTQMVQNGVQPQPNMMPQVPMAVNQTQNSIASSTNPQYVDLQYSKVYFEEIQQLFMSQEFKKSQKKDKKDVVGNTIYKHVEKLVGPEKAPKITGMLIDLPDAELNYSISQWVNFEQKVMSALQLISQSDSNEGIAAKISQTVKQA